LGRTRRQLAVLVLLLIPFGVFIAIQFSLPLESPYVLPYLLALNEPASQSAAPTTGRTILVSQIAAGAFRNITSAVAASNPGDIIGVEAGIYHEEVNVSKPWITISGMNDKKVILDGNFQLHIGIRASQAPGIVVRHLTTRNYLDEGIFFFKSDHWLMQDVISINNKSYELFALASRWGAITDSVAIGGGDSGFYIGETTNCNCLIENSTAYGNVLGYSGTRVDGVTIKDSKFVENSVGIVPNTLPPNIPLVLTGQWKHPFFASNHTIEGNLIENNNNRTVQAQGIAVSFGVPIGTGITLAGVYGNTVENNAIRGNNRWGIAEWYFLAAPTYNVYKSNSFSNNGQDLLSDGTSFFGCSVNETATGDVPPACSVPSFFRLTLPNPFREVELVLDLGRPGYIVDFILGGFSSVLVAGATVSGAMGTVGGVTGSNVTARRLRLAGVVYDGLFVGILYLLVSSILVASVGVSDVASLVNGILALTLLLTPLAYFVFMTIWFVYGLILNSLGRRTLGESIMGLRVVARRSERLTFPRVFVKNVLIYVDSLAFGMVGLLAILLTKRTIGELASRAFTISENDGTS
jgi:uncharacterized RDD family membrane protein YckC